MLDSLQQLGGLCDKLQGCAETCIFSPVPLVVLLLFADGVGVNYLNISWARYFSLVGVQPTSVRLCLCAVCFLAFSKAGTRTASVILPSFLPSTELITADLPCGGPASHVTHEEDLTI
jgi:hypothetical protein